MSGTTYKSPAYRRALAWVVALNLLMGVVELAAGMLSRSQALKADSLDFLGDGIITWVGLAAISRGKLWRARAAFAQGLFLALLAVGIIAVAAYRALKGETPLAEVMSGIGEMGFVVNITCAVLLVPHKQGDASMRAVWLFSRNDAWGNLAVVIAGGVVLWTDSAWPDIITALAIAGLFLHSATEVIRSARRELWQG